MIGLYWLWAVLVLIFAPTGQAFAITGLEAGVKAVTGERPIRLEISTFQNEGPAFDLYILALQQLMQQNQSHPLSYFQISGIHGHPYVAWDGAVGQNHLGYCPHGSVLFPSWHRVYLALFEQVLWGHAKEIASKYPNSSRSEYETAAAKLRMPYWDWALNSTMPDVVNEPMINVNTPNGSHSIANPLYNYSFHPLPSGSDFPKGVKVARFPSTVRYPDAEGRSQPELANKQLNHMAAALRELAYRTFTNEEYAPYSNTFGSYNSIENVHNGIHTLVGGTDGHMTYVPLSSFEPMFWLHHTNIDRLFAMWQVLHPDRYVTPQVDATGTYTNTPGFSEDVTTFLTPFHIDESGRYYNSTAARSTRAFGYTYPELLDWTVNSTSLPSQVMSTVNSLYSGTASRSKWSKLDRSVNSDEYHYAINVAVNGSDVTTAILVRFFLGPIPKEESSWSAASSQVGFHMISGPSRGLSFGQVPLTPKLMDFELADFEPETVIPVIQEQLNYRVQGLSGRAVDPIMLPSLKFAIVGQTVTHRGPHEFPVYGPWRTYTDATVSLVPHGLCDGEDMPA